LLWRIVTWKLMVEELVEKKGLIFGQGIDYASLASPYFLSASIREPHNDYVRNLLEFGINICISFLKTEKIPYLQVVCFIQYLRWQ